MSEKTPIIVMSAVSFIAIIALTLFYQNTVTGSAASTQQVTTGPSVYGRPIPHTITTNNPCKPVHCGRPGKNAYEAGVDEQGHVLCKCPGHLEVFYAVTPVRKY